MISVELNANRVNAAAADSKRVSGATKISVRGEVRASSFGDIIVGIRLRDGANLRATKLAVSKQRIPFSVACGPLFEDADVELFFEVYEDCATQTSNQKLLLEVIDLSWEEDYPENIAFCEKQAFLSETDSTVVIEAPLDKSRFRMIEFSKAVPSFCKVSLLSDNRRCLFSSLSGEDFTIKEFLVGSSDVTVTLESEKPLLEPLAFQVYSQRQTVPIFEKRRLDLGVVVPAFNTEAFIPRAIKSLLQQTLLPCAIYLVDDCSSDNSAALAPDLQALCEASGVKFKYIRLKHNLGPYIAKNLVLSQWGKRHKFWSFLDSDDFSEPKRFETQFEALEGNPNARVSYVHYKRVDTEGKLIKNRGLESRLCYASAFFESNLLDTIGFFDCVRFGADEDFHTRVKTAWGSDGFVVSADILYVAQARAESLTQSGGETVKLEAALCDSQKDFLGSTRSLYAEKVRTLAAASLLTRSVRQPMRASSEMLIPEMAALPEVYVHLATFDSRLKSAKSVVDRILEHSGNQITGVRVCVNGSVAQESALTLFGEHPKLRILAPSKDLKDNGKFVSPEIGINLWLDDDIEYPESYVSDFVAHFLQEPPNTMLSFHGWSGPNFKSRKVAHFKKKSSCFSEHTVLGTGVSGMWITDDWIRRELQMVSSHPTTGMVDLVVAHTCARLGVPRKTMPKSEGYLSAKSDVGGKTLFDSNQSSERLQLLNSFLQKIHSLDKLRSEVEVLDVRDISSERKVLP